MSTTDSTDSRNTIYFMVVIIVFLTAVVIAYQTIGGSIKPAIRDVTYASLSPAEKLDIYLPQGAGPFPLIVHVHGGAFKMGDKKAGAFGHVFAAFLANGYAIASLNYRLSGEAKAPAQIKDVKAAVRWLRAHAAEYKLDPNRFAAWGESAGGNLVALLGTSGGVAELEGEEFENAGISSKVQAVVDWFGPTDFLQMDSQFAKETICGKPAQSHNGADSPESELVGEAIQTKPEAVKTFTNPITYVSPDDPPFLIQHGTADCLVPPGQGRILSEALAAAIGPKKVMLVPIEGAGHGGAEFTSSSNIKLVIDFLNASLILGGSFR